MTVSGEGCVLFSPTGKEYNPPFASPLRSSIVLVLVLVLVLGFHLLGWINPDANLPSLTCLLPSQLAFNQQPPKIENESEHEHEHDFLGGTSSRDH